MRETSLPTLGEREFHKLQRLMADASGISLADNKRSLVAGRLLRRLRVLGLPGYGDYLSLLEDPAQLEERRLVIDLLTTNETYFFREPQHFDFLANWLPTRQGSLRLWSAACSSGEEAYSLAMVLAEHAGRRDWSILASDLSRLVLTKASNAIYPMNEAENLPAGWLQRHCRRGIGEYAGQFRICNELRSRVATREINLMRPLPEDIGQFDLIFLRNVLIYFAPEEKQAIVSRLLASLRSDGLLFIGHAESLHGLDLPLCVVAPSVYRLR